MGMSAKRVKEMADILNGRAQAVTVCKEDKRSKRKNRSQAKTEQKSA